MVPAEFQPAVASLLWEKTERGEGELKLRITESLVNADRERTIRLAVAGRLARASGRLLLNSPVAVNALLTVNDHIPRVDGPKPSKGFWGRMGGRQGVLIGALDYVINAVAFAGNVLSRAGDWEKESPSKLIVPAESVARDMDVVFDRINGRDGYMRRQLGENPAWNERDLKLQTSLVVAQYLYEDLWSLLRDLATVDLRMFVDEHIFGSIMCHNMGRYVSPSDMALVHQLYFMEIAEIINSLYKLVEERIRKFNTREY